MTGHADLREAVRRLADAARLQEVEVKVRRRDIELLLLVKAKAVAEVVNP